MGTTAKAGLLLLLLSGPSFAEPAVPEGGSNHNALAIAAVLALGVCIYHECWKLRPVKAEASSVPEVPQNEYLRRTK